MLNLLALVSAAGILVTWTFYPLFIGFAAHLRRSRAHDEAGAPSVSVVLVTRESAEAIRERVRNCWATAYPRERLEVVVALDRALDPSELEELRSMERSPHLVWSSRPGAGKALALNAGVAAARTDVVIFADTHQRFDETTIPNLVRGLDDPRVGAVSGNLDLPIGGAALARRYWSLERWLRRAEAQIHSCVGVTGAVYAIRRPLWQDLPEGLLLDDVYTPMHLVLRGYRIGFRDDARAYETRRVSVEHEYQRKVRTLTGVLQLCAWQPAILSPFRNPIWLQFLFHKLLRLVTPYWLLLLATWATVQIFDILTSLGPIALATLALGPAWVVRSRGPISRCLRRAFVEVYLLQAAVLIAGVNGLRGRWRVWNA